MSEVVSGAAWMALGVLVFVGIIAAAALALYLLACLVALIVVGIGELIGKVRRTRPAGGEHRG